MNAVEICNVALGRIGQGASSPIHSIEPNVDDSEAARACARSFPLAMACLMREHAWSWAQGSAMLAASAETVPGYAYVFHYPDAAATLHAVTPEGIDLFSQPVQTWPDFASRYPYRIVAAASGESKLIATNLSPALAHYTRAITNPTVTDPLFQDALAWRLAKELVLGLRASPQLAQSAESEYQIALSKAVAANDNEARKAETYYPDDIRAYIGGALGLSLRD